VIAVIALFVMGQMGGIKTLLAKIKSRFDRKDSPDDPGPHQGLDALQTLCKILPEEASKKVCSLVLPHLLQHDHDPLKP
jgi:hypothetical protein